MVVKKVYYHVSVVFLNDLSGTLNTFLTILKFNQPKINVYNNNNNMLLKCT